MLWGFTVGIFKEGVKQTEIGIEFDDIVTTKHEWVGRGDDGMPILEGKVDAIVGKNMEIWWVQGAAQWAARPAEGRSQGGH